MRDNFDIVKIWVKKDEGPYDDDPNDPGGPTNMGITLSDYRNYIDAKGTKEDLERMPDEVGFGIYKNYYWHPNSCDMLPSGIDYFIFDSGLLSGVRTAAKWLQRAVGAYPDGYIGPKTFVALADDHPLDVLIKIEALRRASLKSLSLWEEYGRGWTNRVNKAKIRAVKLINRPAVGATTRAGKPKVSAVEIPAKDHPIRATKDPNSDRARTLA